MCADSGRAGKLYRANREGEGEGEGEREEVQRERAWLVHRQAISQGRGRGRGPLSTAHMGTTSMGGGRGVKAAAVLAAHAGTPATHSGTHVNSHGFFGPNSHQGPERNMPLGGGASASATPNA